MRLVFNNSFRNIKSQFTFLNVRRFELFSMAKQGTDLTTRLLGGKNKGSQGLNNVYESCSFSFLILHYATFPALKICVGGYQEQIWTEHS